MSIQVGDLANESVYLRLDRESGRAVGLQIEGFREESLIRHPEFVEVLDVAELRGMRRDEVVEVRQRLAARPANATMAHFLQGLVISAAD